ncbi:MAG: alpha-glucosidase C-terminal domain-containing protein, partial [bacterium]|nr:alpha-glucosidase C-terminal domain-containing protein [bacterium]
PFNPYIIDGFQTGDEYIYQVANTKALNTETDDDYYFVHRGKLDIFNFSRKPEGNFKEIENEYKNAMKFRESHKDLITLGDFIPLKTNNEKIFAFARCYEGETIIVVGNLDFENTYKKTEVKISGLNQKHEISSINGKDITKIRRGKMFCDINAGEIMVLHIDKFSI